MPTTLTVPHAIGLSGASLLSGYIASWSAYAVPTVITSAASPYLKPRLWERMYTLGAESSPYIALPVAICYGWIAYHTPAQVRLYAGAAAATLAIVPFTLIGMKGVNGKLLAKSAAGEAAEKRDSGAGTVRREGEEVDALLREWITWNAVRALLPFVGSGLGWWAVFHG